MVVKKMTGMNIVFGRYGIFKLLFLCILFFNFAFLNAAFGSFNGSEYNNESLNITSENPDSNIKTPADYTSDLPYDETCHGDCPRTGDNPVIPINNITINNVNLLSLSPTFKGFELKASNNHIHAEGFNVTGMFNNLNIGELFNNIGFNRIGNDRRTRIFKASMRRTEEREYDEDHTRTDDDPAIAIENTTNPLSEIAYTSPDESDNTLVNNVVINDLNLFSVILTFKFFELIASDNNFHAEGFNVRDMFNNLNIGKIFDNIRFNRIDNDRRTRILEALMRNTENEKLTTRIETYLNRINNDANLDGNGEIPADPAFDFSYDEECNGDCTRTDDPAIAIDNTTSLLSEIEYPGMDTRDFPPVNNIIINDLNLFSVVLTLKAFELSASDNDFHAEGFNFEDVFNNLNIGELLSNMGFNTIDNDRRSQDLEESVYDTEDNNLIASIEAYLDGIDTGEIYDGVENENPVADIETMISYIQILIQYINEKESMSC